MAQRWMDRFDLPDEPTPTQSLIEIMGDHRLLIEQHHGVIEYGREMICVKVRFGKVCIVGHGLELRRMTKGQLIVCGCIEFVKLERNDG